MKVFISWSGELSKAVAQILKKYLPCIIQNADVFCSIEDIEKGENWDSRLTTELASSCFGIICLTPSNLNAPWVNFEAGAIAKTLDSRLTALLINLKPSDIQGPLKRYQATNVDERDMRKLVADINKSSGNTISEEVITVTFDAIWPQVKLAINEAVKTFSKGEDGKKSETKTISDTAIEEILQLSRKQSVVISSLENLFQKISIPKQPYNDFPYENSEIAKRLAQQTEIIEMVLVRIKRAIMFSKDKLREVDRDLLRELEVAYDMLSETLRNTSFLNSYKLDETREMRIMSNKRKQMIQAECIELDESKGV